MKTKTIKQQLIDEFEHEQKTFGEYKSKIKDIIRGRMPPPPELLEFAEFLLHAGLMQFGI
jgi:hypothetical protein